MFEDRGAADRARDALVAANVPADSIDIVDQPATPSHDAHAHSRGLWDRIREMFVPHEHAHAYAEGVERGHAMLFVRALPDRQTEVMELLERQHPIDVMKRVDDWTAAGWSGVHRSQTSASPAPVASGAVQARPRMLFENTRDPDHIRSTGLINENDASQGVGAPLRNPMGIEVPGVTWSGTSRVRQYAIDAEDTPEDAV
jgi:hypothetical protein